MVNCAMKNISISKITFFSIILLCMSATPSMAHSKGYCVLPNKDVTPEIGKIARSMLGNPMGVCTPFTIGKTNYEGCVEWHWDQVKGKHKGVTVYRQCEGK